MSLCQICEKRRPRRFCPGLREEICPICCGEEREVTVDCPFDCEFLREARRHERPNQVAPEDIPNRDIRVTDDFLRQNEPLLVHMSGMLLQAAAEAGAVDEDVREALSSMARTYLTKESGLIYESRPNNPFAAGIQQRVQTGVEAFREQVSRQSGLNTIRDKDVLGVLVFLQRVEAHQNNGRSRSRAFLYFLNENFVPPEPPPEEPAAPLISP